MNESTGTQVHSLEELAREVAPSRDLWPELEARLTREAESRHAKPALRFPRELAAAAALIVAVAAGIGIGRVWPPHPSAWTAAPGPSAVTATAYVSDPHYVAAHEALMRALPAQLEALPPKSRAKVAASLAAIQQSLKDIQAALGRDPANALLQEMLINTYQDEMRVLTDVQEASAVGREI